MTTRTAELCSEQGNTDLSELMVIVDMVPCQVLQRYNAKGKSFLHMEQFCKIFRLIRKNAKRHNVAGDDMLTRIAVLGRDV